MVFVLRVFCFLFYYYFLLFVPAATTEEKTTPLTIVHINDFHARFEPTNEHAGSCKAPPDDTCIGGYARLITIVKHLMRMYQDENPIYLNAGDNYQGTAWYTVWRWNATSHFLNYFPADAMTIGNHDFDHGISGLMPFVNGSRSKIVLANLDDRGRERLGNIRPYTILNKNGMRIGIIGLLVQNVHEISNTENLRFLDEIETSKRYVKELRQQNVTVIILLSHCGLDRDIEIAKKVNFVDIIVGGHSHTHMYTGANTAPDIPSTVYPFVVNRPNGQRTLIVQTAGHAKYVGLLSVKFNAKGDAVSWTGNPVYLSADIQPDQRVRKEVERWKKELGDFTERVIGYTNQYLGIEKCKVEECLLGDLIADAMVNAWRNVIDMHGNPFTLTAFLNAGSIRTALAEGDITYGDLLTLSPFENSIDVIKVSGEIILQALEHSVSKKEENVFRGFLQMSGSHVKYNLTKDIGQRVIDVGILNPATGEFDGINMEKEYYVVVNSFIRNGGDGFIMFKNATFERGPKDSDVIGYHIQQTSPIERLQAGRILFPTRDAT